MATNSKQRVTIFINPKVIKQAKVQAIIEEINLTTLIEKALISYLPKEIVINKSEIKVDFDR